MKNKRTFDVIGTGRPRAGLGAGTCSQSFNKCVLYAKHCATLWGDQDE